MRRLPANDVYILGVRHCNSALREAGNERCDLQGLSSLCPATTQLHTPLFVNHVERLESLCASWAIQGRAWRVPRGAT